MALNRIKVESNNSSKKSAVNDDRVPFTPIGSGEYEGRLVYVADLGLQERKFGGEEKAPCQQLALGIELVGKNHADGTPRYLWTRAFNIFPKMDEKSNEYKMYKVFDTNAKPDTVADWDAVLGEPCTVKVVAVPSKTDPTIKYDNISDLIPIPAKYRKGVQAQELNPCVGDCDDEENGATKALYGLAKYIWNKRLVEAPRKSIMEDDVPY